jgi:AcrR family transcriptional regulator
MATLRERKKAATRQAISDVATRLFEASGFEAVSLADIAAAADVSVKTIWNHFGSKEELFFDHEDEVLGVLLATLAQRRDLSPALALRPVLERPVLGGDACRWADLDGPLYEGMRAYVACEEASPTLRARRLAIIHGWEAPLGAAVGSEVWAALFAGVLVLRHRTLSDALLERRRPRTIERRVRHVTGEALAALERGFAG